MRSYLIAAAAIAMVLGAVAFGYFQGAVETELEGESSWSPRIASGPLLAALVIDPSVQGERTCPANGTTTPTITVNGAVGRWYITAEVETVYLCYAATCASGGQPIIVGAPLLQDIAPSSVISCRSVGGTGILRITSAKYSP